MDEEEREAEFRRLSRDLISDAEFNGILEQLADQYYRHAVDHDASQLATSLLCYEDGIENNVRKVVLLSLADVRLDQQSLNDLGKTIYNMELSPVAVFLVGYGNFFVREDGEGREAPGIIIGGITIDSRSAHAQVELISGLRKPIPVRKLVFPYKEDDGKQRFNGLEAIFDGYAEFMKIGEVTDNLAQGFSSIGLWRGDAN